MNQNNFAFPGFPNGFRRFVEPGVGRFGLRWSAAWIGLLMWMLMGASPSAMAQSFPGTFSAKNIIGGAKRLILNKDGAALKVAVGRVEIVRNGTVLASGSLTLDGTFLFGVINVDGTAPGDFTTVTVRAWDTSTGATYDTAGVRGAQSVQVGPLGGGTVPPIEMTNFASFQLAAVNTATQGVFSAKNLIDGKAVPILAPNGTPLPAASGAVEFLVGGTVFLSGWLVEDGVFALGVASVPGTTVGNIATITVRAWDKTTGSTYDTATVRGSETLQVGPLGGNLIPPVPLSNFQPLQLQGSSSTSPGTFSAKNLIGTEKRSILDPSGKPLATAVGAVELLVNNAVIASGGLVEDGVFVLGAVTVPGFAEGSTAPVTVRAWDKSTGNSYDTASTRGSVTIQVGPLGGSITPPVAMNNFASFQLTGIPPVVGGTFSAKNLIGTERRYILNAQGAPLAASIGAIDIVYKGSVIKSGVLIQDGVFILGTVAVPGTALNDTVTLTFRAWDLSSGATFDAATRKGVQDVVVGPLGGDITPPVALNLFKSFSISSGLVPPAITSQPPASVVKNQGASTSLTVVATGTGLSFQWQKDSLPLKDSATVTGTASPTLNLTQLTAASRGLYRVVVSNAAGSVTNAGTVLGVLVPQTINPGTLPTLSYGDTAVLNPSASSGLPVLLKLSSGPATLTGNTLTATGVGTVVLTATQAGSAEFQPADATFTLTVKKALQKLTWPAVPALTYGGAPVQLKVTSSSGLPVTLATTPLGTALTVSGTTVTITSAGVANLKATQAGSALYEAISETREFTVAKAKQTLTFAALADTAWKTNAIPLVASSSAKLPVSFSVTAGAAQVQGSNLILLNTGVGTVTVNATQSGDSNYESATAVSRSFVVTKATQTISFLPIVSLTEGDPSVKLTATASSGLPVTFSVNNALAVISGDQLTPKSAGAVVVTASQAGNAVYQAAQATLNINILTKPTVPPVASLVASAGGFKIVFRGEKGRAHAVEASATVDGIWQEVGNASGNGTDTDAQVTLPSSSDRIRFFRIRAK